MPSPPQDEEEAGKEQEEFKLRIAWQYRRYIQAQAGPPGGTVPHYGGLGASSGGAGRVGAVTAAAGSSGGASSGSGAARKPVGLRDWCHRFDLLKPIGEEGLQQCKAELVDCSNSANGSSGGSEGGGQGSAPSSGAASSGGGTQTLLAAAAQFVAALAAAQPQLPG